MNVLVINCSPNRDGLTAACAQAAAAGAREGGADAEEIRLNDLSVGNCRACGNGWGTCRSDHACQVQDDFQALHTRLCQADAIVMVTPVYWGDLAESAKALTDRLRRCEATRGDESALLNKRILGVAAAGGSGNGTITCLANLERWIQHVRAQRWDLIAVNRWVRPVALDTIRATARAMVQG
jgi:multimeric flavodoxin WrbA